MRLASAFTLGLLLWTPVLAQTARVTAVRFWSVGDVTRVAIETSQEVPYRYERITDPDRLFFDFEQAQPPRGQRGVATVPVGDALLKQIRVARTKPNVTRVVLDLAAPVEYSVSQLRNPDRIIVELRATGGMQTGPPLRSVTGSHKLDEPDDAPAPAPASAAPKPEPPPEKALAAKADSSGNRSLIRALGLKLGRVVLDPGHGGHDTGTIGRGGLQEKDVVLDIAKRLGMMLEERLGSEVFYTRTDDTFVPLETRTAIANEKRADLFLSIHANSSRSTRVSGAETFYLNFTTSADALEVAARENATSQKSIHELESLLQKIALKEKIQESREFAKTVQHAMHNGLWRGTRNRGVKQAPFIVLIGARMPSILAEVGFLSNPRDEAQLKTPAFRQKVAEALFKGVSEYASTLSHFEVAKGK